MRNSRRSRAQLPGEARLVGGRNAVSALAVSCNTFYGETREHRCGLSLLAGLCPRDTRTVWSVFNSPHCSKDHAGKKPAGLSSPIQISAQPLGTLRAAAQGLSQAPHYPVT